ncbi:glycosyltransferase, partial [Streptomyces sp. NPDC058955]|uniref:glycosyltransferase n=1 Tax=Streptomyces sp. NPDC058955 TaxID=3346678 RepID=UPI00368EBA81
TAPPPPPGPARTRRAHTLHTRAQPAPPTLPLAGDSGGAPDAVLDGETGWVVRGESAEDTADRVTTLLLDPDLRARMGERGRAWVEEKWRWDLLAEKLRELL